MRHEEGTAQREVNLVASKFESGSKPGLKNIFEALTQHPMIIVYTSYCCRVKFIPGTRTRYC